MKSKFFAGAFILVLSFSCDKEKDPVPVTALTVEVKPKYFEDGAEGWVFITNDAGNVLDIQLLQNGKTDSLQSARLPDKFSVTFFRRSLSNSTENFSLETYTGIDKNAKLILGYDFVTPDSPPFFGYADFVITDYSESASPASVMHFSNGFYGGLNTSILAGTSSFADNTFKATGFLPESSSDFLITAYRAGEPVYSFVKGIKSNDKINLSFNEFKKYDNIIDLGTDENTVGVIYGFYNKSNGKGGYLLGSTDLLPDSSTPRRVGYIDGFDLYDTYFMNFKKNESIWYTKYGPLPPTTSFTWPTYTIDITDMTPQNFSFTTPNKYAHKSVSWFYQPANLSINWNILGDPNTNCRIYSFPKELVEKYPLLDFSKLNFGGISINDDKDGYTYEDYLRDRFSGTSPKRQLAESWMYSKF